VSCNPLVGQKMAEPGELGELGVLAELQSMRHGVCSSCISCQLLGLATTVIAYFVDYQRRCYFTPSISFVPKHLAVLRKGILRWFWVGLSELSL